jgi:hypothetical protein
LMKLQVTGAAVWPHHDVLVNEPLQVVSPLQHPPALAEVDTADALQAAFQAGAAHIVLNRHIDMTELTARGQETQLPFWTDSIRVRIPQAAAPISCVLLLLFSPPCWCKGPSWSWQSACKLCQSMFEHQGDRSDKPAANANATAIHRQDVYFSGVLFCPILYA